MHSSFLSPDGSASPSGDLGRALRAGKLSAPAVTFLTLSAATPLTVVTGVVPTGISVTGVTGFPLAFVVIGVVFGVFCVGYLAMARSMATSASGGFYVFIGRGLGRVAAVGCAWVAVIAYTALTVGLYGLIGAATAPIIADLTGTTVPWQVIAVTALLIVGGLGLMKITLSATVLGVLVVAEILVITVYTVANLTHPATGPLNTDLWAAGALFGHGGGTAAVLALGALGFVGSELAVVYTQEAREPRRGITIATFTTIGILTALYAVATWAMSVTIERGHLTDEATATGSDMLFSLARANIGAGAATLGQVLFVTSLLAGMVAFHNVTARYALTLGRAHVAPAVLSRRSRRFNAPYIGSLAQSVIGAVIIVAVSVAGADPVQILFYWAGTSGAIGILILLAATSLAVLVFFARRHSDTANGAPRFRAAVLSTALVAASALLVLLGLVLANIDGLLGVGPDSPVPALVVGIYAGVFTLGVLWALVLASRRPGIYRGITGTRPTDTTAALTSAVEAL